MRFFMLKIILLLLSVNKMLYIWRCVFFMLLMAVFKDELFLIRNGGLHLALFGGLFADRRVHEYTVDRLVPVL